MRILIPALGRTTNEWNDLLVLTTSLTAYAPTVPVTVVWRGQKPPPIFVDKRIALPGNIPNGYGPAVRHLLASCEDEDLLIVNDDCVFTPDTVGVLLEDLRFVKNGGSPGLVGLRSNYVAGVQNVRFPLGPLSGLQYASETCVLEAPRVFGVAFYVSRTSLESVTDDWLKLHWFGDNLLSYDLVNTGKRHYISRAYVHHHGSRSGADYAKYHKESMEWLEKHRPDFYSDYLELQGGKPESVRVIGTPEMVKNTERVPPRHAPSAGVGSSPPSH